MPHTVDMIIDLQFGSTGKGLLAGYLAKRKQYDTAICAFAPNAGHTYKDRSRDLEVMTQQLPTAITSPTVKNILIGPGALICIDTLFAEMHRYERFLGGKNIWIHPHAAIVTQYHRDLEANGVYSNIGSTTKGVGEAAIDRIRRIPGNNNAAKSFADRLGTLLATPEQYRTIIEQSEAILLEGAQGFSLSMYHGWYPYTTSRDVTPWQIAADCGLPFKLASYVSVFGTLRTFPIRVNNRTGSSGPGYSDQRELDWEKDLPGIAPELTTVTKLPRRIFTFSYKQLEEAMWHCGQYWKTHLFLNFANYHKDVLDTRHLIQRIETPQGMVFNPPRVEFIGYGADDSDVRTRTEFNSMVDNEGGID